jgi:hypothetical protein
MAGVATSDGAVCGSDGVAAVAGTRVCRLTQWTFNPTTSTSEWGDSDSAGYTNRKGARKDGTGSLVGKMEDTQKVHQDLFMPGDTVQLTLWENATTDYWYMARALITNYSVTFDQDTKEVVEWNADFGADGKYFRPGEAGIPSQSFPS